MSGLNRSGASCARGVADGTDPPGNGQQAARPSLLTGTYPLGIPMQSESEKEQDPERVGVLKSCGRVFGESVVRPKNQTPAAIFSAFLRASASVPTYMKALSGRSSPSPLQMRSKLSMVSSSGQVTPGRPVNTSPT